MPGWTQTKLEILLLLRVESACQPPAAGELRRPSLVQLTGKFSPAARVA